MRQSDLPRDSSDAEGKGDFFPLIKIMEQLISYTFTEVIGLMTSEYFKYSVGVIIVFGVFDLLYKFMRGNS